MKTILLSILLFSGCAEHAQTHVPVEQEHEYGWPGRKPSVKDHYERGDLDWMKDAKEKMRQ